MGRQVVFDKGALTESLSVPVSVTPNIALLNQFLQKKQFFFTMKDLKIDDKYYPYCDTAEDAIKHFTRIVVNQNCTI